VKNLLSLLVVAAVVPSSALGQSSPGPLPRIVTSGQGQVRSVPDRATVFVGVQTRATTAATAAADNARRQKAIMDTLRAMGFGSDQLATQNYSVSPEMKYEPSGTSRVTGYTVSNTVRVELKRIDQVGSVIDASLAKGANQIGGIQFSVSTAEESRRTAMADAVRSARADAEALARAAGGSLGPLIELSSSATSVRPVYEDMASRGEVAMARVQTPIEPGEQVISARVSAIWQFIPGPSR
jgi:uncharacterized protein YggE